MEIPHQVASLTPQGRAKEFRTEQEVPIDSWTLFETTISKLKGEWIFRGQSDDWQLTTSLERTLDDWEVGPNERPNVEHQMIRDFRRRYRGPDHALVQNDTLYCLTTMQHHGAPTRLLDWTYSPFVAAKFAIEKGLRRRAVIWCVRAAWCYKAASEIMGKEAIDKRDADETRNDSSFVPLFLRSDPRRFIFHENPYHITERSITQQGTFLCPGDIRASFLSNLQELKGWDGSENILRFCLSLEQGELARFATVLQKMNVNSAFLSPGLDGFARSLAEQIPFYVGLGGRSVGLPGQRVDEESNPI